MHECAADPTHRPVHPSESNRLMAPCTHGRTPPTPAGPHRQPIGRTRRLLLAVTAIATVATATSCGGNDDGASSDPTPAADPTTTGSSPTTDTSATSTSGDGEVGLGALPDACDVIVLEDWEAITGIDLTVPEQDTGLIPGGGTVCGVAAEGDLIPYLFTVSVAPRNSAGGVENLASFLDVYVGMEQIDGIGDRALYWDQDTTYEGDAVTDWPLLAFEDGAADVTIALLADGLGRAELEQLAKAVADKV